MRYIFFGTPEFAQIVLEKLISAGLPPVAVVTNPDRPAGRKQLLTPPDIKKFLSHLDRSGEISIRRSNEISRQARNDNAKPVIARSEATKQSSIDILQPEKLDDPAFAQQIESYNADVFVLAAYGKILPEWLIKMPPKGIVGVHPSLLPKYRGATPIQSAILADEETTGTTLFLLDEEIDHGAIIANCKLQIANFNTYKTLSKKLAELSGELLIKTLPKYLAGKIAPHQQNHKEATYTKKFTTEDGFIEYETLRQAQGINTNGHSEQREESFKDPSPTAQDDTIRIYRKIRALNPEPGVFTINEKNRRVKLLEADFVDGKLIITKIQEEGKKPKTVE